MRVAYLGRRHLFTNTGGDAIQIKKTRDFIVKQFDDVEIECFRDAKTLLEASKMQAFDIIHIFGICFPHEIIGHLALLKRSCRRLVISSIYVDYSEFEALGRKNPGSRFVSRLLGKSMMEMLKILIKACLGRSSLSIRYLVLGHRRSIQRILAACDLLLPNSRSEALRVQADFGYKGPSELVTNAYDTDIFDPKAVHPRQDLQGFVVCVGRIEGLKNQLFLIRACKRLKLPLALIGKPALNQPRYFQACLDELPDNSRYLGPLSQEQIASAFAAAAVAVLPSWFETTGLASLEAAALGTPIVITDKGDTREYFGDGAYYCDPASVGSIEHAIRQAIESGRGAKTIPNLSSRTWEHAARQTYDAYQKIL